MYHIIRWFQILGEIGDKQKNTVEERVAILEFQVAGLEDDVTSINTEVTDLGDDVDVIDGEVEAILAGQVLQDERILELEMDSDGIRTFSFGEQ